MLLIHQHLLKSFLRNLGYTLVASLILFIMMDLLDHMNSFMDNEATISMMARFYTYKAVWIIDTVLPVAMLMSTLFTLGGMARYLELTALFSSGWSLMKVTRPLVLFAVFITFFSLAWGEYVVPKANTASDRIWEVEIHKKPDRILPTNHISITGPEGRLYHARKFNPNTQTINGLKILTRQGSVITERIDAETAFWDDDHWTLTQGTRRIFENNEEKVMVFEKLTARDLKVNPKSFYHNRVRREDMNIRLLLDHVELIRISGGDPTTAKVDIQFNLAFPMVNLIVVLIGLVLASGPRKTTVAQGFGLTLLVSFGYYLFMNFGRVLGHTGTLPPLVAAWTGNVFFFIVFLIMFSRARR
ncbi:MAG: YjgP/YjgQ family permease [bacterium]|nr:YjgP/YjgQ family permease [bacterium]